MRYISTIFATFMLLLVTGCVDNHFVPEQNVNNEYTIVVSARMPSDNNGSSRVSLEKSSESLALIAKWSENDKIKMFFAQEGNVFEGEEATLYDISQDGKRCSFNITVPQSVNVYAPFDLYGFCGIQGLGVCINNGKILADVTPIECREIAQLSAPVWFNASVREISKEISADFSHLGSYEVIHVQNNSSEEVDMSKCRLAPFGNDAVKWYHSQSDGCRPFFDPVTKEVEELQAQHSAPGNHTLKIAAGQSKAIVSWYVPKAVNIPEFQLQLGNNLSVNTKPAKDFGMRAGKAYYVFGVWDGQHLTITDEDFSLPEGFEPEMEAIIKVHEAIDPIADEALLSDNPEEELKKVAEQFKDNPEIESIEFDRNKLAIKYKNGGWVFWLITKNVASDNVLPVVLGGSSTRSITETYGLKKKDYPKILYIYQQVNDLKYDEIISTAKDFIAQLEQNGVNVTTVYGGDFNLKFASSSLKNYDAVFIGTHGCFDNEGNTWLTTGEKYTKKRLKEIRKLWKEDEIAFGKLEERRFYGLKTVSYFSISQKFIERSYQKGDFPANSFFYTGACEIMKDPENKFAKVLQSKGFNKIVGYNNTSIDNMSYYNGALLLYNLLCGKSYNEIYTSFVESVRYQEDSKGKFVYMDGKPTTGVKRQDIYLLGKTSIEYSTYLVSYPANTDFRFKILQLDTNEIQFLQGDERTVEISGGSGNYSITNSNDTVVSATLFYNKISLRAIAEGEAVITVTDNETKRMETIAVTVTSNSGSGSVVDVPGRDL